MQSGDGANFATYACKIIPPSPFRTVSCGLISAGASPPPYGVSISERLKISTTANIVSNITGEANITLQSKI